MGKFDSWLPSGMFDPKTAGRSGLRDFEDERRQKAYDVMALGGLTPEQVLEANRLQFTKERAPQETGYDPNPFKSPDGLRDFEDERRQKAYDVMAGAESAFNNPGIMNRQPDQGVQFTPEQKDLSKVYSDLVTSVKAARVPPAASKAGTDLAAMSLKSLESLIKGYQVNPPITPEDKAQFEALKVEYNRKQRIPPPKTPPAAPAEAAAPAEQPTSWWDKFWGKKPAAAPASGGFKAAKMSLEEMNKLRAASGLPLLTKLPGER